MTRRVFLLAVLSLLLTACAFAYVPLVPEPQPWEPLLELRGSQGLAVEDQRLALHLHLEEVPEAGWLALQWLDPRNQPAASASIWITPQDKGHSRFIYLPEDVTLMPGRWRVIVSFGDVVLRQFSLEVAFHGLWVGVIYHSYRGGTA